MLKSQKPTGNVQQNIATLFDLVNALSNAVNRPQMAGTPRVEGKSGDFRFVQREDGRMYFMARGDKAWYTTFSGVFQESGNTIPIPHFPYLTVDNLYAKMFTVAQTQATNGDLVITDSAIIEAFHQNRILFKDQTNLNLCPFVVGDKCEIRHVKADKSADIRLVQFTVDAVNGKVIDVTYTGAGRPKIGDIVIRKGHATNADRQNTIWMITNGDTAPRISLYSGTTGFTLAALPDVVLGKLDGLTDPDFGALSGYSIYAQNAYFKGDIKMTNQGSISISGFDNDAGFITSGDIPHIPVSFYQSSTPAGAVTGDFWFDTTAGTYRLKRYNGSTWDSIGVYMDANGVYAGNVTAGQVTAGTLTGFTIQTASSGERIIIDGSTHRINIYDNMGTDCGYLTGNGGLLYASGTFGAGSSITTASYKVTGTEIIDIGKNIYNIHNIDCSGYFNVANKFYVTDTGQLQVVNNTNASTCSGYALISNGTSYTPTAFTSFSYPGAGIVRSTGSAWATSITDNHDHWDTAYNWGNHATAGYLTSVSWGDISGKPATFAPSSHNNTAHSETYITSASLTWANISDKPATFTPSSHNHDGTDITSAVNLANASYSTYECAWGNVTGKTTTTIQYKDWSGNNQSVTVVTTA